MLDKNFIETGWWILKVFDEGLLYEGHKILPYCPRCGTGLASHEVAQGYKEIKSNTADRRSLRERARTTNISWPGPPRRGRWLPMRL